MVKAKSIPVFRPDGRPVPLGESLGRGGQGEVFASGEMCAAKIFSKRSLQGDRAQFRSKVRKLIESKARSKARVSHQILWPLTELVGGRGLFVGYLMPKVASPKPLHEAVRSMGLDPKKSIADRLDVATQLAQIFSLLHWMGFIVADVSSNNLLLGKEPDGSNRLHLIDVDSMRLPGYPAPVRTERYKRPEELRGEVKTDVCLESDRHALAYLLFEVFMRGASPYAHKGGGSTAENIEKEFFPYEAKKSSKAAPTMFAPFWKGLPPQLQSAFASCFARRRLSSTEWVKLLESCPARQPSRFFLFPRKAS